MICSHDDSLREQNIQKCTAGEILSQNRDCSATHRYQSSAIADLTTTVGYLTAIMSIVSQCLLPRAKFIKIMFFNLLSTCVVAALCCLVIVCAVSVRQNDASPDSMLEVYDSSASAVCAVWLMFAIWFVSRVLYKPISLCSSGSQTLFGHIIQWNYKILW
jgi:hypothetical protein